MELLQTTFQSAGVYAQLIVVYLPPNYIPLNLLTYGVPILSIFISVVVQWFYAWRISVISGRRLRWLAFLVVLVSLRILSPDVLILTFCVSFLSDNQLPALSAQ